MLRIATVVIGAKVMPMPAPAMIAGHQEVDPRRVRAGDDRRVRLIPIVNSVMPVIRMYLPPIRSARRPAKGATTIDVSDIGARVSPAVQRGEVHAPTAGRS